MTIQDGENVDLVVISDNEKVYNKAQESVQTANESNEIEVCVKKETSKQLDAANELNISVGRYLAIEEYSNKTGGSVEENSQKLKDKSNSDIKKFLSKYKTNSSQKEKHESSEVQAEIETTTQPTTTQKQTPTTKATQKKPEHTKQPQQTTKATYTHPTKPNIDHPTQPQTQPDKTQPTQTQPTTTKYVDKNSDVKLPNIKPDYDDDEWDDDDKRDDDDNKYENDNNKNNDWNLNNIKDFFGSLHDKFGFED